MRFLKFTSLALFAGLAFTACDDDDVDPVTAASVDLTGTYEQEDIMGRPGITTVLLAGQNGDKDAFNVSLPSNREAFTDDFVETVNAYYGAYGAEYENNILGLDAATTLTVLSQFDALQVAPEGTTTYFESTSLALTGRRLQDDIVDVSLILLFGGNSGARFNGDAGLPELVSDNVGFGDRQVLSNFPYMPNPLTQ